jgi:hypothetical protein
MGVLCAASYAELDDLSTSGDPKPQLLTSAESAFGSFAAVVAVWNSFTFCEIGSVAPRAAIGGRESPPLPWPRGHMSGTHQSRRGSGALSSTAISACLVDHSLAVRWQTRSVQPRQGRAGAGGPSISPALTGTAGSVLGCLVAGLVLLAGKEDHLARLQAGILVKECG